ncbi:MAG: YceI family protein [Phenylobacterium sp.]|uniref:YceI family protein n=1 Tax=Phenylobacterium sp. TaxID=1871053 RepID=UPI00391BC506
MKKLVTACALLALAACSPKAEKAADKAPETAAKTAPAAPVTDAPAGTYTLDKTHASLVFRVNHLGLSNYTARFTKLDGELKFDPENPSASSVTATIDPRSIETDFPNREPDFDAELAGKSWLDAEQFPQITFRSTGVDLTGPNTARVTGDLELHGVTRPISFDVTFNGGYASFPPDTSGSRIGFSGRGTLNRSDFGVAYGIPPEGSTMGVGDLVEYQIEVEFVRPTDAPAAAAPAKK